MKRLLLSIILLFSVLVAFADKIYYFKSYSVSTYTWIDNRWKIDSPWKQDYGDIVVFNLDKLEITFNGDTYKLKEILIYPYKQDNEVIKYKYKSTGNMIVTLFINKGGQTIEVWDEWPKVYMKKIKARKI